MTKARDNANADGLDLITSVTVGTAVSSVIISNCFSSTYDTYQVILSNITASSDWAKVQLRTGSTTAASNYSAQQFFGNYASNTGGYDTNFSFSGTGFQAGVVTNSLQVKISNPYLARNTLFNQYGGTASYHFLTGGIHAVSTSYDGLVLSPATSTWTGGTISVYGYRK